MIKNIKKSNKSFKTSIDMLQYECGKYELLTIEQERELCRDMRKGNVLIDKKIEDTLIMANTRFAQLLAKRYADVVKKMHGSISYDDVVSASLEGLCKAAKKFTPNRGNKFITYAAWYSRKCILRLFQGFKFKVGKNDSGENFFASETSIDKHFGDGEDAGCLLNLIENQDVEDPFNSLARENEKGFLRYLIDKLDDRESYIIKRHFGYLVYDEDDKVTLEVIGNEMELTRERVRQIEKTGIEKLRYMYNNEMQAAYAA